MVAFVVGSTFLNRAQFDLFYHLVGVVVCFEVIAVSEMRGLARREPVGLRGGSFQLHLPGGFRRGPARGGFRDGSGRQPA